jgi:tetratricopeptide (TPR) repeat protein/TolB-like protein
LALSLLVGIGGLAARRTGSVPLVGPREAGAEGAADGIAVLPFHMSGEGMDVYREGMVDLMSANLDGLSEYRAIDARTLLARWNRDIGETADVELTQALRVAGATGARYAVVGSGVDAGTQVRLDAAIYDVADGSRIGSTARVEGGEDEVLSLIDRLTVEVMRSILAGSGAASQAQALRVASLLTESVPALRHYLTGDAYFRRAQFEEARNAFRSALEEDSTFALAYWRLGDTHGWIDGIASPESRENRRRAAEFADRLPERERTLLLVQTAIVNGNVGQDEMEELRDYVDRYPDDPDGWFLLGEAGLHAWSDTGVTDTELEEALYRTVQLDPTFGPYYEHALHWATAKGHESMYDSLITAAEQVGDAADRRERMRLRWALFQGDEAARSEAAARLEELEPLDVLRVDQAAGGLLDTELERLEPLWTRHDRRQIFRTRMLGQQGRLVEMVRLAESDPELLDEAVYQLVEWTHAGAVPEELLDRLDRALGPSERRVGDLYWAGRELDMARGRPREVQRDLARVEEELNDWLPQMAENMDTVGVRPGMRAFVEAEELAARGRADEAWDVLAAVDSAEGPPPSYVTERYARIALDAGAYEAAIPALEGVSRGNQRSLVKFRLGVAYEAIGDTTKALDAYQTFLSRAAPADEQLGAVIQARDAVSRLGG